MDEKDQTILWMARALAQSKMNEARLNGEVLKGNAIIRELEERLSREAPPADSAATPSGPASS